MTIKIKEIQYLFNIPPRDIFNDALDVFVILDDDYCTDGFCYFVEVTTPQFLSTIMEKENSAFLSPDYPCIIVSKLTDDIIRAAIESFMNSDDGMYWLKLYDIMPSLEIEEINEILYRKKQESIELSVEVELELDQEMIFFYYLIIYALMFFYSYVIKIISISS